MSQAPVPSIWARIFLLSWAAYFRTLFDPEFARAVVSLREGKRLPAPSDPPSSDAPRSQPPSLRRSEPEAALQVLSLLQREGRFIDFLEEDVASYSDAQIGAAARVVHEGCRKALREHVPLAPIRSEDEGATISVEKGYDASSLRLTGNVQGEPPFRGVLAHRGWRARAVNLPKLAEGHDARVIAPAEVEL